MRIAFTLLFICIVSLVSRAQHVELDSLTAEEGFENIHVQQISDDSLQSNYVIWIRNSVPLHYHAEHSETVLILEGEGRMTLGDSTMDVGPNSFIHIPKGVIHGVKVTSSRRMKVLSTQCPHFDGADRHPVEK